MGWFAYLLFLCISVLYMVIGDNYQAAVWFVEVLVSRSRLRAGLSGFYCLDDLHLESPARLGVVNSYLRYELVSYTNEHIQGMGSGGQMIRTTAGVRAVHA